MIDYEFVIKDLNKLCSNVNELNDLRNKINENNNEKSKLLNKQQDDIINGLNVELQSSIDENINVISKKIKLLVNKLKEDYPTKDNKEFNYSSYDIKSLEISLRNSINELNEFINELNNVNYGTLVPPVKVKFYQKAHRGLIQDKKPLVLLVNKIYECCDKITSICKYVALKYKENYNLDYFFDKMKTLKEKEIKNYHENGEFLYKEEIRRIITNDRDNLFTKIKVDNYLELKEKYKPNTDSVSNEYKQYIALGDISFFVDQVVKNYDYRENNSILSSNKYLSKIFSYSNVNSMVTVPLITNLKDKGNFLIRVNDEEYSNNTKKLVNQLIIEFLLSIPINRLKLCLVDINDSMEFSSFKVLTKINNDILMNGIVRDDRNLENTIKDIEQLMYRINDDIISFNNVEDIYEYNSKYAANQQNFYLFVLSNYPSGIRLDLSKRIEKIVKNGPKAGVFTIIVDNQNSKFEYNFSEEEYNKSIENIKLNSLEIIENNNSFKLNLDFPNKIQLFDEYNIEYIQKFVNMVVENTDSKAQIVVPLQDMFDDSNEAIKSTKFLPASIALDIPIGSRGGEIQNLYLPTTGDGSCHTVIIGGTGSGKSNLLHTIIMSACYKYSPEDLNLYLIDFKGGVEFKYYEAGKSRSKQIPHIKLTGLTSDLEDGVSILNNLRKELNDRETLFRKNGVEDIVQYTEIGKKIPRLLIIIDEIQELFEQDDKLGQKAIDILRELFKKGRAFGISVLWASQNVPKVPGLKDKILSQIGNRISLRLNEPDDAADIKIDPKAVRNLNRPEKGLGLINDIRYGNDSIEFRVAFAESSKNRNKYTDMILNKWKDIPNNKPLYIVGDDDDLSPISSQTIYTLYDQMKNNNNNIFDYTIQLGQDYITGNPYNIDIELRRNNNILISGGEYEIIEDLMGYSALSIIANNRINNSFINEKNIYYINGEYINSKNENNLFNIIKDDFSDNIINSSTKNDFIESIKELYKLYKKRGNEYSQLGSKAILTPEFVLINDIQNFSDIFDDNPTLYITNEEDEYKKENLDGLELAMAMFASSKPKDKGDSISFVEAFKELLEKGFKQGIIFIISTDNPYSIQQLKTQFNNIANKVLVKGTSENVASQLIGEYRISSILNNPKIAIFANSSEKEKFRVYRFTDNEKSWYKSFIKG